MKFKLELDPMDLPALSKYHVCNETECKECVDGKVPTELGKMLLEFLEAFTDIKSKREYNND